MTAPELDRLFQVPLGEFTSTRDALARELRRQGEREQAQATKQLRKPSVAAWAINQVRHHKPDRVRELLDAGGRLRQAQSALLGGGDRGQLRDAAATERRLVGEVVRLAVDELEQAGHPAGAAVQTKIHETLHAAAGDDEVRQLLSLGKLQRDYQLGDLGLAGGPAATSASARRTPAPAPSASQDRGAAALKRRLEQARARQKELRGRVTEAAAAARSAHRELARMSAVVEKADAAIERANDRLDAAS